MPIYMLAPARSLLCFLAGQRVGGVCCSVLTSYAHEMFDEMPEPHLLSFLPSKLDLQATFSLICVGLAVHQLHKCSKRLATSSLHLSLLV